MSNPLVSVLMTAYNREQFIAEAIESVLASDYQNFELLIFDDCSTDKTVNIAEKYLADERVKLHINSKNLGDYPNRNKAAETARGKYIMFCDSDDKFFVQSISYCVAAMEEKDALMGMYYKENVGNPFYKSSAIAIREHFFGGRPLLDIGPGGTILRRDFFQRIGQYPVQYGPANDMYFNLKAASQTSILFLPWLFLFYREHPQQENKQLFQYIYHNYNYIKDALTQLQLPLSVEEIEFLNNKNRRRFISNLVKSCRSIKNMNKMSLLISKTGFTFTDLRKGIFHKNTY